MKTCCDKPYWVVDSSTAICRNCGATKACAVAAYQPSQWIRTYVNPNISPYQGPFGGSTIGAPHGGTLMFNEQVTGSSPLNFPPGHTLS